jgi:hypothetical protein
MFDEDQNPYDDTPQKVTSNVKSLLPVTLLSAPLDEKKVVKLNKKEKRMYTMQKSKWEQVIKINSKKYQHPSETKFTLEDARQLIRGIYH